MSDADYVGPEKTVRSKKKKLPGTEAKKPASTKKRSEEQEKLCKCPFFLWTYFDFILGTDQSPAQISAFYLGWAGYQKAQQVSVHTDLADLTIEETAALEFFE
jgi:hypothetical protein